MRHAGPSAHVQVEVVYAPGFIVLFVDDDGPGVRTDGGRGADGARGEGHGILGMQERVAAVGGMLQAGPRQPGPGWRVHARFPLGIEGA